MVFSRRVDSLKQIKTIGILGGMGPEASAELYRRILKLCQVSHRAVQDGDYPRIMIFSMAPKGSDETGIKNRDVLLTEFIDGIIRLTVSGCDFAVLPCNTAHTFISELKKHVKIPIISMTEKAVQKAAKLKMHRIGLLSSEDSYQEGVYEAQLKQHGITLIKPEIDDRKRITQIILHVMGGKIKKGDKKVLISIINKLKKKSAEGVIIGCTELPLVIKKEESPIKAIDTLDVLAEAAIEEAYS